MTRAVDLAAELDRVGPWPAPIGSIGIDLYSVRHAVQTPSDLMTFLRTVEVSLAVLPLSEDSRRHGWTDSYLLQELKRLDIRPAYALRLPLLAQATSPELVRSLVRMLPPGCEVIVFGANDRSEAGSRLTAQADVILEPKLLGLNGEGYKVSLENHKEFIVSELEEIMATLSQSVGLSLTYDLGNQLAVLEDPLVGLRALSKWAQTLQIKDIALKRTNDGQWWWRSVPLGLGVVPLHECLKHARQMNNPPVLVFEVSTSGPWRKADQSVTRNALHGDQECIPHPEIDKILTRGSATRSQIARQELQHLFDAARRVRILQMGAK